MYSFVFVFLVHSEYNKARNNLHFQFAKSWKLYKNVLKQGYFYAVLYRSPEMAICPKFMCCFSFDVVSFIYYSLFWIFFTSFLNFVFFMLILIMIFVFSLPDYLLKQAFFFVLFNIYFVTFKIYSPLKFGISEVLLYRFVIFILKCLNNHCIEYSCLCLYLAEMKAMRIPAWHSDVVKG